MRIRTTVTTTAIIIVMIALVLLSSTTTFDTLSFAVSMGRTTVNGTTKQPTNPTSATSHFIHSTNPTPITVATSHSTSTTTTTPIKHIVVIFQENISFDHYFGTYPNATNPKNEPQFTAAPKTPKANNLITP
ncbi:MAG: alkaline phosphatase family protein, partial [Nitrososphaeraceae archaeon]